jgi:hypothetical protein
MQYPYRDCADRFAMYAIRARMLVSTARTGVLPLLIHKQKTSALRLNHNQHHSTVRRATCGPRILSSGIKRWTDMLTLQVFAIKTLNIANQFLQFVNIFKRRALEITLSYREVEFQA